MKGIHDYIIEIAEPFKETFKTESGLELYANKSFSADRLSNRIGKVMEVPLLFDGIIKQGYEVLIDASILYEQSFKSVKQESIHLLDRDKMLFKINPNLIVLYRENENEQWKGFLNNLLVEPIEKKSQKLVSSLIIIPDEKATYEKGKAIVKYANENVKELGVNNGETVFIDPLGGIQFWLDGKEFWWIRTKDILAKYE